MYVTAHGTAAPPQFADRQMAETPLIEPDSVTVLAKRWAQGEEAAGEPLLELVYDELRKLAGRYLRRERRDHTLPPTGLVHEAYLRMMRSDMQGVAINNRAHFFAVAAQAMRRILVEHARRYEAERRASPKDRVQLPDDHPWQRIDAPALEVLAIHEALYKLRKVNERQAQIVELRYFAGLTESEIAEILGVSRATVAREWRVARMLLRRILEPDSATDSETE